MVNLNQFRVAHEVLRLKGLTAASRSLGISQPAISMQLRNFQDGIGFSLYRINGRRLEPTSAGHRLMEIGDQLFAVAKQLDEFVVERKAQAHTRLTLATTRTAATHVLPDSLRAIQAAGIVAQLRVDIGENSWCQEQVLNGLADVALVFDAQPHQALSLVNLITDQLVLIGMPKVDLNPRRMKGELLLVREAGSCTRLHSDAIMKAFGIDHPQILEVGDAEAIKRAVAAGLGLGLVPMLSVQDELTRGLLSVHMFGLQSARMSVDMIRRRAESTPISRRFEEAIVRRTEGHVRSDDCGPSGASVDAVLLSSSPLR